MASGVKCWKITKEGKKEIPDLKAQHEEADTRLALHAAHASKAGKQSVIIIISEDTDGFLICLAHCSMIGVPIFQMTGSRTQFVDISRLAQIIFFEMTSHRASH